MSAHAALLAMPTLRRGVVADARIGGGDLTGGVRVRVTVNSLADAPVEVFVDVDHREGSHLREQGHAFARLASRCLRAGWSVADIVADMRGVTGGPEGSVHGCEGVAYATSLPDLVAQVLELAAAKRGG